MVIEVLAKSPITQGLLILKKTQKVCDKKMLKLVEEQNISK
ncbi:MAG: hypothetical protein V1773_15845 [bacterium]